jgi:hypothetical protein
MKGGLINEPTIILCEMMIEERRGFRLAKWDEIVRDD